MNARLLIISFLLLALGAPAQQPTVPKPITPLTEALLLAQRPTGISVEQWRELIRKPTTASLYPIRLSQAMLDTLDVKQLDIRYQYVFVRVPHDRIRNLRPAPSTP